MKKGIGVIIGLLFIIGCKREKSTETDTQPPTVNIIKPVNQEIIKQSKDTIIIDAHDNKGVSKVELYIDNTLRMSYASPPYEYIWDLLQYPSGSSHTIYAKAYDNANNVAVSPQVTVKIQTRDTIVVSKEVNQEIPDGSFLNVGLSVSDAPSGAVTGWVKVEVNISDYYPEDDCILVSLITPTQTQYLIGDDSFGFPLIIEIPNQLAGQSVNGTWYIRAEDMCPDDFVEGKFQSCKLWVEWKFPGK